MRTRCLVRTLFPKFLLLLVFGNHFTPAHAAGDAASSLRETFAAVCDAPASSLQEMVERIPEADGIGEEPLVIRDTEVGWERRFALPEGDEVRVERFAPGGQLRRLAVEYHEAVPDGDTRPLLVAVADAECTIRQGRRLRYEPDFPQPVAIEYLDGELEPTGEREPLNPPVPDGLDPGGVPVALVDAGVNYLLPEIGRRLARDNEGEILGHDWWEKDARPFDAHPVRSIFFPQRHGTRTASLLLREAPDVRLVPYRYPRPDMSRMAELIEDAADKGVGIVNISMGGDDRADWDAFAAAARAHPEMLFVLSAGNNGRDIDDRPVYPAALQLDNAITVTSAEAGGEPARGSNWSRESVDLLVPAERMHVTGFDGSDRSVSGSSYAAVRISALAARLQAEHPDWRAAELKEAIFARVLPSFSGEPGRVAAGFMPRPDKAERLPPLSAEGRPREVARHAFDGETLYPDDSSAAAGDPLFEPTFVYFEDTDWTREQLQRHARASAEILAQCGIRVPRVDVRVLNGPEVYRYFHDRIGSALVERLELPKPAVYFVRDTLQVDAYEAEAIGKSNSGTRPALRDTVWFTEGTSDPGIALAHEWAHVLMDSGRHVETPGNLMRADTDPSNTELTSAQCEAMVARGTENGLIKAPR